MISKSLNKRLTISLLILGMVVSQSYAQYEIKKYSINSGSKTMSKDQYELNSIIGQTDANKPLSAGDYSVSAGFMQENTDLIYRNGFK